MSEEVRSMAEDYEGAEEHPDALDLGREWAWFAVHGREANQLFDGETPRGAAVLARAYIEAMVVDTLVLLARRQRELAEQINAALGAGLGAKIQALASYSGVYAGAVGQMRLLKLIGDRFAHRPRTKTFDNPEVIKLLRRLDRAAWEGGESSEDAVPSGEPEPDEDREVARRGQSIIAFSLFLCIGAMSPLLVGDESPSHENG